jgi:hypothetical protein
LLLGRGSTGVDAVNVDISAGRDDDDAVARIENLNIAGAGLRRNNFGRANEAKPIPISKSIPIVR